MRLQEFLDHAPAHPAFLNVGIDSHHDQPENIQVSNTVLVVPPLPGGPGVWTIALPDEATVVMFSLRSMQDVAMGGAKAGVVGIATANQFAATAMTLGGHGTLGTTAYNMVYSKAAAALNLSDKVFSSLGTGISLRECYITGGAGARVLHTEWTNYSAGLLTLNVWAEIAIIG